MRRLWLIVPAAGIGSRMAADRPKQYLPLATLTVLAETLHRLYGALPQAKLCVKLVTDDTYFDADDVSHDEGRRIAGGAERADTVSAALQAMVAEAQDDD